MQNKLCTSTHFDKLKSYNIPREREREKLLNKHGHAAQSPRLLWSAQSQIFSFADFPHVTVCHYQVLSPPASQRLRQNRVHPEPPHHVPSPGTGISRDV